MNTLDQLINHIVLVLDASSSMTHLTRETVKVADSLVASLAQRSQEMNQETRITVYTFDTKVQCHFYDKDVLRLPSIASMYKPHGATALIDATMQSIKELEQTATLYGDHAFLTYVLTDGEENSSQKYHPKILKLSLEQQADNWTTACLVPNDLGKQDALKFGFLPGNTAIWSTTSQGMVEVGEVIKQTTDNFMVNRAAGVRGSRNLFSLDVAKVDINKLTKLNPGQYSFIKVGDIPDLQIRDVFQDATGKTYHKGDAYYELTKRETVQPQKDIVVVDRDTGAAYAGSSARQMLGLPHEHVDVKPVEHPKYRIFVQSTSVNRKLVPNTALLVLA